MKKLTFCLSFFLSLAATACGGSDSGGGGDFID